MLSKNILKFGDIILFKGKFYNPIHLMIMWRSLSKYVHTVNYVGNGICFEAGMKGITKRNLEDFKGREVLVKRLRDDVLIYKNQKQMYDWITYQYNTSKNYDYKAWLGFTFGFKELQNNNEWYCSELSYYWYQENGIELSEKDLVFVYPGFFENHILFKTVYFGKLI